MNEQMYIKHLCFSPLSIFLKDNNLAAPNQARHRYCIVFSQFGSIHLNRLFVLMWLVWLIVYLFIFFAWGFEHFQSQKKICLSINGPLLSKVFKDSKNVMARKLVIVHSSRSCSTIVVIPISSPLTLAKLIFIF